jgi:hypothetical protein
VWQALVDKGRLRSDRNGVFEIIEQQNNP